MIKIYDRFICKNEELKTIREQLLSISSDKTQGALEKQAASFYLNVLKPYDERVLKRQKGLGVELEDRVIIILLLCLLLNEMNRELRL